MHPLARLCCLILPLAVASGCSRTIADIGQAPEFTPAQMSMEHTAMMSPGLPVALGPEPMPPAVAMASLWTGDRGSLLGDQRAVRRGDILTVVIEINDSARISNSTDRSRSGAQSMEVPSLFGVPERFARNSEVGATLTPAVDLGSSSTFSGDGSVRRNEQLTLRVAATVVDVLPNGVLAIEGSQQVRVNFEMRELIVTGFVRPTDVTRQNEITYDKIAQARISYGGQGQISEMQQPRYGQQAAEILLPF